MTFPYERIVAWAAGPAAIAGGWLASFLAVHLSIFGHVPKAQAAAYIAKAIVFAVGALVTYAAHHKWLDNVPKWWAVTQEPALAAQVPSDLAGPPSDYSDPTDNGQQAPEGSPVVTPTMAAPGGVVTTPAPTPPAAA